MIAKQVYKNRDTSKSFCQSHGLIFLFSLIVSLVTHVLFLLYFPCQSENLIAEQFSELKGERSKIKTQLSLIKEDEQFIKKKTKNLQLSTPTMSQVSSQANNEISDLTKSTEDLGKKTFLAQYLTEIRNLIVNHKFKNKLATKYNLKGEVGLNFTIVNPNVVKVIKVINSSGHPALDDSAVETIRSIEKFPSIPSALEVSSLDVSFVLDYQ